MSLALKTKGLTTSQKFVLVALANYADQEGRCWPSQAALAADTAQSERQIRNALKALELEGLIIRQKRRQGQRQTSDLFRLNLQAEHHAASEPKNTSQAEHMTVSGGTQRHSQAEHCSDEPSLEPSKNLRRAREARDVEASSRALVKAPSLRKAISSPPKETPAQMAARIRALAKSSHAA